MVAVTFGMLVSTIHTTGNLTAAGICGTPKPDGTCAAPMIAYVSAKGLCSALSFLILGSQAALIPLSANMSKEEIHDSLSRVAHVLFIDTDAIDPELVAKVRGQMEEVGNIQEHEARTVMEDPELFHTQQCTCFVLKRNRQLSAAVVGMAQCIATPDASMPAPVLSIKW